MAKPPLRHSANENPKGDSVAVRGHVVDPEGNPVAHAQIVLGFPARPSRETGQLPGAEDQPARMVDSRSSLSRERCAFRDLTTKIAPRSPHSSRVSGPIGSSSIPEGAGKELTLRLRRDDVPIEGRVINLEGKPVRGLTIYIASLMEFPAGLLKKVRENAGKSNPGIFGTRWAAPSFWEGRPNFLGPDRDRRPVSPDRDRPRPRGPPAHRGRAVRAVARGGLHVERSRVHPSAPAR